MTTKGTISNPVVGHVSVISPLEEVTFQVETDEFDSDSELPKNISDTKVSGDECRQSPLSEQMEHSISLWEYIDECIDKSCFINNIYTIADNENISSTSGEGRKYDGFARGLKPSTDPRVWPLW